MAGFGLIVIGDEVLSGQVQDLHVPNTIKLLKGCSQALKWVRYVGDEFEPLVEVLKNSFACGDTVLVTGGIGATPDDRTRLAAATALGLELQPHPDGVAILNEKYGDDIYPNRIQLVSFPAGAELIPNPVNRIPGFSIAGHHFVPGFPCMAGPMLAWVMQEYYADRPPSLLLEKHMKVFNSYESQFTPLLEQLELAYPHINTFSLPSTEEGEPWVDLGVKGMDRGSLQEAFEWLRAELLKFKGVVVEV
jgi:molybdopterin-biosynthesis enzyme MoeA-like protein